MDISNIKVIRALWGNFEHYQNEIPKQPIYNEVVYVWGIENADKLKELGYEVVFMGDGVHKSKHSFYLKLECLIRAENEFKEILFIDWDVKQCKELDDIFYKELRELKFSMPTYSYPIEFLNLKFEHDWGNNIVNDFKKYGWRLDNFIVIPNAGFIYSNDSNIPHQLYKISKENNINTLTEEFSMWKFANCSLKDYILRYEPKCIYGRPIDNNFKLETIEKKSEIDLHNFINGLIDKNIYFVHE